ncbi:GAF domain-containing protein [Streptomyces sp. NPDC006879]|uniref:GAF domain-containing protein n=1 Tax=Streptomyces sp. NPDC006879 TaxID=3364767 RepID=UPI0036A24DE0
MTFYESTGHLLLTPVDLQAPERTLRLRELGLGNRAEESLDDFAARIGREFETSCAGVNFIDESRQFFAGLHHTGPEEPSGRAYPQRVLARDRGYCPYVVVRRRALVLEDVRDFSRFAANAVADENGVRSYIGAPLMDRRGFALGTVCAVDTVPRTWGREGLDRIKALAAELVEQIRQREETD